MKKRIISAAILVPILFLLTLAAPVIAASLVMSALMAIAAYELLDRTGLVKRARLVIYSCIMAAAVCMWPPAVMQAASPTPSAMVLHAPYRPRYGVSNPRIV